MSAEEAAPTARVEVVAGGVPSDVEVAALVLALTPRPVAPEHDDDGGAPTGPAAWALAGLREGVGGRPAASPGDLVARTV